MKKSILISGVLLIILAIATSVYAYETSDYSIDVPSSCKEFGTAIYKADNGNNFNIQVTDYDQKKDGYPYTDKNLEELAKQMESTMKAKVSKKEITKCTKNNYKCIHLQSELYGFIIDQYAVVSGNKIYTVTLAAANKDDLNSGDLKNVLDSFTLKNYQEPQNGLSPVLIGAIVGAGVGALMGIISVVKRKKENTTTNVNTENKE